MKKILKECDFIFNRLDALSLEIKKEFYSHGLLVYNITIIKNDLENLKNSLIKLDENRKKSGMARKTKKILAEIFKEK